MTYIRNMLRASADLRLVLVTLGILAAADGAGAQNVTLPPTFGTVNLDAAVPFEPNVVNLVAGGDRRFANGACAGFVADAPDYRVNYVARAGRPLSFTVESGSDTVLVINAPDGSWHCNDDFFGLDPAVSFEVPLSGQYDIWVGTFEADDFPQAALVMVQHFIQ